MNEEERKKLEERAGFPINLTPAPMIYKSEKQITKEATERNKQEIERMEKLK